jgi:hypothetical protein
MSEREDRKAILTETGPLETSAMSDDSHTHSGGDGSSLDHFFSRFSKAFSSFSARHHLRVDKYWHDFPSWRFSFKHPKGGVGCIEVFREGEAQISVYKYWWLDNYEQGTRFSKRRESGILDVDTARMADLLSEALQEITSWPLDSWTETVTGFGPSWTKHFSKEQFKALSDNYPALEF